MLDLFGPTEGQTEHQCGLDSRVQRTSEPRGCGQDGTSPPTHYAGIPERVTDGQEVVIGHDGVEEALGAAQEVEGVELGHTVGKETGLPSGATRIISILVMVTVENDISVKDRWVRKCSTWGCAGRDSL